jgi:outer membrane immunogenic protein
MNRLLHASAALLALGLNVPAKAADMPVKYDAPKVSTWTGCYVGVAGGWIGVDRRYDRFASGESVNAGGPLGLIVSETTVSSGAEKSGGLVGGTVGCNWQSASSLVFGLEGDVSWLSNKVSFSETFRGDYQPDAPY